VAPLIRGNLLVDTGNVGKTCIGSTQHLERGLLKPDLLHLWPHVSPPQVVKQHRAFKIPCREDEAFSPQIWADLAPSLQRGCGPW
jgi:hypothetical protein